MLIICALFLLLKNKNSFRLELIFHNLTYVN